MKFLRSCLLALNLFELHGHKWDLESVRHILAYSQSAVFVWIASFRIISLIPDVISTDRNQSPSSPLALTSANLRPRSRGRHGWSRFWNAEQSWRCIFGVVESSPVGLWSKTSRPRGVLNTLWGALGSVWDTFGCPDGVWHIFGATFYLGVDNELTYVLYRSNLVHCAPYQTHPCTLHRSNLVHGAPYCIFWYIFSFNSEILQRSNVFG